VPAGRPNAWLSAAAATVVSRPPLGPSPSEFHARPVRAREGEREDGRARSADQRGQAALERLDHEVRQRDGRGAGRAVEEFHVAGKVTPVDCRHREET
jgi:hypothetical protein